MKFILLNLYVGDVSEEPRDAVVRLSVEGFELCDLQLFGDQVRVSSFVRLVQDRRNGPESEFLQNLRHKVRLHFACDLVTVVLVKVTWKNKNC